MKNGFIKVLILIILLGIIMLISGFLLFTKKDGLKEENAYQINTKNLKDISTSEGIASVINSNFNVYGCMDLFFSYFVDKKVTVDDLDKDVIDGTILNLINIHGVEIKEGKTFTQKAVKKQVDSFYGKDYKYQYSDFEKTCPKISYDNKSKKYTVQKKDCELTCNPRSVRKLVQAKENDSIVELYYRILFVGSKKQQYQYYTDYQKKNKIDVTFDAQKYNYGNMEDGISDEVINKGSLYKVTFVKEKENLIFLMSEPVGE